MVTPDRGTNETSRSVVSRLGGAPSGKRQGAALNAGEQWLDIYVHGEYQRVLRLQFRWDQPSGGNQRWTDVNGQGQPRTNGAPPRGVRTRCHGEGQWTGSGGALRHLPADSERQHT